MTKKQSQLTFRSQPTQSPIYVLVGGAYSHSGEYLLSISEVECPAKAENIICTEAEPILSLPAVVNMDFDSVALNYTEIYAEGCGVYGYMRRVLWYCK